ncbi:uncharacterized protein EI90DRAFT_3050810 [Cantharellus anzutake]|uniref:uncharacterized protein n=1 Tax=Cantharellus anzutake TaxID=1750568 RepID=UPI00190895D1|nr:uncharacterized protein EI90DRAFT_3050810 [Cantharellus anzutake]KAF8334048.1 hypothetical protein EI90DRAFT_3050810 [Cantharellus anzutake]
MVRFSNTHLCVARGGKSGLAHPTLVHSELCSDALRKGEIILRVETFGFSANNITYGLLGEHPHFRYFDFFHAPETASTSQVSHGVIPVWGFGTVVATSHATVRVGQRLYGYFAMSKYLVLQLDEQTNKYHVNVSLGKFGKDRRPYKQLTICKTDPMYQKDREAEIMLYRPLFWTSYWFEDWLYAKQYFGAHTVLVSSASSKTSFTVAYNIQRRKKTTGSLDVNVIGLTSPSNVQFTRSLGLYDGVFTYDELDQVMMTVPSPHPLVYVDVLGNSSLNSRVNKVFSPSMFVPLGIDIWEDKTKTNVKGFFTPEWLAVRIAQLSPQQILEMQVEAWAALMKDCRKWVKIEKTYGLGNDGVQRYYWKTLEGKIAAEIGQAFSLWEESDVLDFQKGKAKL